jgi:ribonucleoside-diphosphate reductase beta chain
MADLQEARRAPDGEPWMGRTRIHVRRSFWPNFFSRIVARLQWDAEAIDLAPDAAAWPGLPEERRARLTTLLSSFCMAEQAVAEQLTPYGEAAKTTAMDSEESLMAWVFFLQRRDEVRHARLFDRIAAEVLELPGDTPQERRAVARRHAPAALIELFEEQLPAMAADLADGRAGLADGVGLYHMLLEGVVFDAGQDALLDVTAGQPLPGIREGVLRVQRDERWHIGFGLRCLIESHPSPDFLDELVERAELAAAAWGDAVPADVREQAVHRCARRLTIVEREREREAAA